MFEHSSTPWGHISPGEQENLLCVGIFGFAGRRMRVSFGLRCFFRERLELLDHFYQVSEGFCLHLLRRPAALNFYGAFRSAEFSGNLFVEHSRNDHGNYFLLASSQRVEAPPKSRHFLLLFAPGAVPIKCDANSIEKILVPKWFGKKFDRSRFH